MKFELNLPAHFKDVKDQNHILFLAFLYKISLTYGGKYIYKIYDTDVRTILGLVHQDPNLYIEEQEWSKYVTIADVGTGAWGYRIKQVKFQGAGENVCTKELTDQRCILVWMYLLGCFNNNLLEDIGTKPKKGLKPQYKTILTGVYPMN